MLSIKLAVICTVISTLSRSVPAQANLEECIGDSLHIDADLLPGPIEKMCSREEYLHGALSLDGCRLICSNFQRTDVMHVAREEPLKCCIGGYTIGKCVNGRCRSRLFNAKHATKTSDYRIFAITVMDFGTNPDGPPPEQLRVKIIYKQARSDNQASYEDEDTICESELNRVEQEDRTHYKVRFDFSCTTLLVHKLARIKFLVEDPDSVYKREHITMAGEPEFGTIDMGIGDKQDLLKVSMLTLPR